MLCYEQPLQRKPGMNHVTKQEQVPWTNYDLADLLMS